MHFTLDRRTARQRQASRALAGAVPVAAAVFWVLPNLLTAAVGSYWNEPLAIVIAVTPLAALHRVASAGRTPRQAVLEGIAGGAAAALLYAWVFTAPWLSAPGY
jgi:hypothetical protein